MTETRLRRLLEAGESIRLEYKEAKNELPSSVFGTICAFLNREGGDILLGVDDKGRLQGVEPSAVERIAAGIASATNDGDFLDPPFLLYPQKLTRATTRRSGSIPTSASRTSPQ